MNDENGDFIIYQTEDLDLYATSVDYNPKDEKSYKS